MSGRVSDSEESALREELVRLRCENKEMAKENAALLVSLSERESSLKKSVGDMKLCRESEAAALSKVEELELKFRKELEKIRNDSQAKLRLEIEAKMQEEKNMLLAKQDVNVKEARVREAFALAKAEAAENRLKKAESRFRSEIMS